MCRLALTTTGISHGASGKVRRPYRVSLWRVGGSSLVSSPLPWAVVWNFPGGLTWETVLEWQPVAISPGDRESGTAEVMVPEGFQLASGWARMWSSPLVFRGQS
jgi:hypothetical protein